MFSGFFKRTPPPTQESSLDTHHTTPTSSNNNSDHLNNNNSLSTSSSLPEPETISSMLGSLNHNHPVFPGLSPVSTDNIEYLYIEENPFAAKTERATGSFGPLPMRNNSDKLLYGTGALYMMGLSAGGAYGFLRGLRVASGRSFKLKTNSVLNMTTRYGPFLGNFMGVLALCWATFDVGLEAIRGKTDYYNHISAAFLSGALFKSTAGLRPAFLTGSAMAAVVAGYGLWASRSGDKSSSMQMPEMEGRFSLQNQA